MTSTNQVAGCKSITPLTYTNQMVLNCYTEAFDFASPSPGPEELAVVEVGNFPGSWVASYSAQMAGSREDSVYPENEVYWHWTCQNGSVKHHLLLDHCILLV